MLGRGGAHVAEVEGEALDLVRLQPDVVDDDVVVRRLRRPLETVVRAHVEVELPVTVAVRVSLGRRFRFGFRLAARLDWYAVGGCAHRGGRGDGAWCRVQACGAAPVRWR